jgi:hypothetical protein
MPAEDVRVDPLPLHGPVRVKHFSTETKITLTCSP